MVQNFLGAKPPLSLILAYRRRATGRPCHLDRVQAIQCGMQLSRVQGTPMAIALTPEVEQYVQAKVSSGQYASASEVFLAGIYPGRTLFDADLAVVGKN